MQLPNLHIYKCLAMISGKQNSFFIFFAKSSRIKWFKIKQRVIEFINNCRFSWAGFNIIEVMSSSKFTEKRQGYLAACQSFHKDTEVLMLTTNMIRKDLSSQNTYDAGVALSSLACFMSPDLARDLSGDIMSLLSSTRPYIRKKAVLILYKVTLTIIIDT